jgi:hypothetical protein
VDPQRFVKELGTVTKQGQPILRNLVVYPPYEPPTGDSTDVVARQPVRGERLQATRNGRRVYMPFVLFAPVPFKFDAKAAPPGPRYSVRDLLEQRKLARSGADTSYAYAWWATTPMIVALWGGGSFALIGGAWPVVLSLLVGAGFGRHDAKEPAYDLDRFGNGEPAAAAAGPVRDMDAEMARLHELEQQLEASLADGAGAATPEAESPAPVLPVPLLGTSGDPEPDGAERREHHYRGQFYPVDIPDHPHTSKED